MKDRSPQAATHDFSASAALTLSAAVMLVPANLLPVINTEIAGRNRTDTIFSGIVELWRDGLAPIAAIVFTASIVVPMLKLAGLSWLMYNARRGSRGHPRELTRLYALLDFIGRWSMLDVFLIAFLAGLVQFGTLARIEPRSGIIAFAVAVVCTVLATEAFDPRIFWQEGAPASPPPPA